MKDSLFKEIIEKRLVELSSRSSSYFPNLYEAGRYVLHSGGKRIRPLLTLAATAMISEKNLSLALDPACALEVVHTYSLIHDDLPCMDNDDFRRGLPTLHRVYNEGHAVLAGDYLLTYAFEILSKAPGLSSDQKLSLIQILSYESGAEGMIGGQVMDLEKSPHIQEMHFRKTAALFSAALQFAGVISNADDELMLKLKEFGLFFGRLFQLADDLADRDHPLGEEKARQALALLKTQSEEILNQFSGNKRYIYDILSGIS